jgi:predicted ATPase
MNSAHNGQLVVPLSQSIFRFAAVIGRSFDFDLLEVSTKMKPETLLDSVDQAARVGLIRSSIDYAEARLEFSHELIRQVVLALLSAARRPRLHLEVGEAIERLYSDAVEDHYAELAHHYEQTVNTAKAVHYLYLAACQALERSAHVEAIELLSTGLERLKMLTDSLERDRTELKLQLAIGTVAVALRGFSAPEVENAYSRAVTLSHRLDDRPRRALEISRGCSTCRASATSRARCSQKSTAGSAKASTPPI